MLDWDDLRFFLSIARSGSLSGAAKHLHVAQSTVGRRLASLEDSLGVRLLNRTPEGYVPTLAGDDVRKQAEPSASLRLGFPPPSPAPPNIDSDYADSLECVTFTGAEGTMSIAAWGCQDPNVSVLMQCRGRRTREERQSRFLSHPAGAPTASGPSQVWLMASFQRGKRCHNSRHPASIGATRSSASSMSSEVVRIALSGCVTTELKGKPAWTA
ncbi:LysR family transcriptional regulator [Lichenifustis flavocetrariae]|uniref:LysR family transcriptional regulator n=1 Tax=Lichenifustis flavocetrariae TaxID=2949735 RepID=A0AA41Z4H5_9HYPH|nr:LysR family transcriptional regulator [Lichenifustis flavocetrariae]MCW6512645.1 LysR family transcriptional regulator [Lichenifustis flavocetrariae]